MSVRRVARRDDGPLPTPVLIDVERDLWQAGYRDWDAEGREYRVAGETFTGQRAAWEQSQALVAARKAQGTDGGAVPPWEIRP